MRRISLSLFAVFVAALMFGCHGESITGPPMGPTALSGQVMMTGNLAGSSPAGIAVTCSGQVSVTDANGNFAFASISPELAGRIAPLSTNSFNMHFTRGDGIDASGSVNSGAATVTVYLQKSQAQIVAGQSNAPSDGGNTGQTKELEGPITKISASSITVHNASTNSDVTAAITGSTVIRKGNTQLKPSDLHVGDRVHVKTTGSGDSLTATEILLQNPA
ncbi:MAG TPA: DUF5666 domain-containing protein [Thermoanaerobaculia bacterium]